MKYFSKLKIVFLCWIIKDLLRTPLYSLQSKQLSTINVIIMIVINIGWSKPVLINLNSFMPNYNTSKFLNIPVILNIPYLPLHQHFEEENVILRSLWKYRFCSYLWKYQYWRKMPFIRYFWKNFFFAQKYAHFGE